MRTRMIVLALLVSAAVTGVVTAANRPDTYVYKNGDGLYSRISGSAINRIGEIYKKYGNEFVWLRMNGRSYVIRDAATLAQVRDAFRHLEQMDPTMREAERRMKPFEQELEKIEDRVDSLGDSLDDENLSDAKRDAIEDKLRDAEEKMRGVEEKMRVVERELEKLEKQAEKLEKVAETRFEVIVQRAVEQGVAERVE